MGPQQSRTNLFRWRTHNVTLNASYSPQLFTDVANLQTNYALHLVTVDTKRHQCCLDTRPAVVPYLVTRWHQLTVLSLFGWWRRVSLELKIFSIPINMHVYDENLCNFSDISNNQLLSFPF